MGNVSVHSEVGRLRKVIVHTPGPELLAVTPSNRREYLYDDLIDLGLAREEHLRFKSLLARFSDVYEVSELLEQTLVVPEAREFLFSRSEEVTANRRLREEIGDCEPAELVRRYLEGWRMASGPIASHLESRNFVLPPLPNMFFTRDASMVIGDSVVISAMRFRSRWPEEALMRTIFGFHPDLGEPDVLFDGSDERRYDYMLEGGDIHPLSPEVVVAGVSERTSVAALDLLSELLFERTEFTELIAVILPEKTTAIHLDMVWTQIDRDACVAHPPMFRGPKRAPIVHRRKGKHTVLEPASLFDALGSVGLPTEPIWAGGDARETQEREQWASGCNFVAVAPGQAISYARNDHTLRSLQSAGFRVVDGGELLLGKDTIGEGDRAVMTFYGPELVRGGGGPRCMTCPILRDPVQ